MVYLITNSLKFCKFMFFLRGCSFPYKNVGSIRINHSSNINDTIRYCLPDYPNPLRSSTELYSGCFVHTSHFHCCNLISISKCTLPKHEFTFKSPYKFALINLTFIACSHVTYHWLLVSANLKFNYINLRASERWCQAFKYTIENAMPSRRSRVFLESSCLFDD